MKQYTDLLEDILLNGTYKAPAREGMPCTYSLFGEQMKFDLSEGFPLVTTKKMYWKGVVTELIWFLRGDVNIKFLVDNKLNIWNEDAYNYYMKMCSNPELEDDVLDILKLDMINSKYEPYTYEEFVEFIKSSAKADLPTCREYTLGDCGNQYGKTWRNFGDKGVDQIANIIESLSTKPESRRHIVSSVDVERDTELALYWCHSLFQFNTRRIRIEDRCKLYEKQLLEFDEMELNDTERKDFYSTVTHEALNELGVPEFYLDCQMYQRSADAFLGVPFNIASYALLTHIIAKFVDMIPGNFIHSLGDVHLYENHLDVAEEQIKRHGMELPELFLADVDFDKFDWELDSIEDLISMDMDLIHEHIKLIGYESHPKLVGKLSTGLQ